MNTFFKENCDIYVRSYATNVYTHNFLMLLCLLSLNTRTIFPSLGSLCPYPLTSVVHQPSHSLIYTSKSSIALLFAARPNLRALPSCGGSSNVPTSLLSHALRVRVAWIVLSIRASCRFLSPSFFVVFSTYIHTHMQIKIDKYYRR